MTATIVMYINAVFGAIFSLQGGHFLWGLVLVVGPVAAGLGIANEKKWGYWLGVVLTAVTLAYIILYPSFGGIINLLFYGALLALLLHPQSRSYRRTWFR
jgi:hypothetical protein